MVRFRLLWSCLFLLMSNICNAQGQDPWANYGIEANLFVGKVFKHEAKFELPLPALTTGVDMNFFVKTYGNKEWEQRRRYPTIGLGITYTNYGIDSVYGRCFSLYPNITIPIITGKRLEWTVRIGDGIGYVTRDYSRGSPFDTINNAIGSHVNDYFSFLTDIRYHINDHWDVQLGGNFSHISDASFHQPNLGINLFGAHIGVRYFPVTSNAKKIVRDLKPLKNRWLAQFRLGMAYDQLQAAKGPTYPVYLGTAYVSRRWLSKNKMFAGIDASYHESIYSFLRNNGIYATQSEAAAHSYKSAVFIGNEFLLGRVGIVLQAGYYIHEAAQELGPYYEKLGGNLYLIKRETGPVKEFFLCGYLKVHRAVAELAEFGFGMGF